MSLEGIEALLEIGQGLLEESRRREREEEDLALEEAKKRRAEEIEATRGRLPEPLREFMDPESFEHDIADRSPHWLEEKVVVCIPGFAPIRVTLFKDDVAMLDLTRGERLPYGVKFQLPMADVWINGVKEFAGWGIYYRDLPVVLAMARELQAKYEEREMRWREDMATAQVEPQMDEPEYVSDDPEMVPYEQLIHNLRDIVREIVRVETGQI